MRVITTLRIKERRIKMIKDKVEEVQARNIRIDGVTVEVLDSQMASANILQVSAGTNGLQAKGAEHECHAYIAFRDLAGTDLRVAPTYHKGECDGVELALSGNGGLITLIRGLRFILKVLEQQAEE